ncbi:MAG: thiamine phosphate synthase [Candidatus Limousia pullorum]
MLDNFKLVCVTARKLCGDDFIKRLENISKNCDLIILREKDLTEEEYFSLAEKFLNVCSNGMATLVLHCFWKKALELHHDKIHLSLKDFRENPIVREKFSLVGVSVHSLEEAKEAEALGADYVTAGHIFETDCKKGLKGRGLEFLRQVSQGVSIPVYAIGGISTENMEQVREAGANGACIMSGFMKADDFGDSFYKRKTEILEKENRA